MPNSTICCGPKPDLRERPLITIEQASDLENVFKVLANDTRLRILHALVRSDEMCVTDIADEVEMKTQAVSNQLQRLLDQNIIASRREGNNVYYKVVDPCIVRLLDQGICLTEDTTPCNCRQGGEPE